MPNGALSPSDYPSEIITIRCDRCDRTGRYRRATIIARFGDDIGMPEVLSRIANCERSARLSADGCKAIYLELRAAADATD